jgi:hypothetical protein
MTAQCGNATRKIQAAVEHVFACQEQRLTIPHALFAEPLDIGHPDQPSKSSSLG